MSDKQIEEINEQIKKAIQKVENISKKYDELREKYKTKEQECERLKETCKEMNEVIRTETTRCSLVNSLNDELDQLKAENEILEKVNKKNQEKIKKLNETLQEEFIAKQYGDEALFFTLMDIKEIAETAVKGGYATKSFDYTQGMETIGSYVLQKIKEVIKDEE